MKRVKSSTVNLEQSYISQISKMCNSLAAYTTDLFLAENAENILDLTHTSFNYFWFASCFRF